MSEFKHVVSDHMSKMLADLDREFPRIAKQAAPVGMLDRRAPTTKLARVYEDALIEIRRVAWEFPADKQLQKVAEIAERALAQR